MIQYLKTNFIGTVENYPYWYTLKTNATFGIEFKKNKWFRTVFQTVNPKTWKLNKPKVSTYSDIILMYVNEEWQYKYNHVDLNVNSEELNKKIAIIEENKNLFTEDELQYISNSILMTCKVSMMSMATYCWSDIEKLKPLYKDFIVKIKEKDFSARLDFNAIEGTKIEWYNPRKSV